MCNGPMRRCAAVDTLQSRVMEPVSDVDQFVRKRFQVQRFDIVITGEELIAPSPDKTAGT